MNNTMQGRKTYTALATVAAGLALKHFAPSMADDADTVGLVADLLIEGA